MVFNEEYSSSYDYFYKDKDYEKECDFLESIFEKFSYKPKTILDIGCGTGGHALVLAKRGYDIVGIDRSIHMLNIAKQKKNELGLEAELIEGDITKIVLNRKFDAIISMFAVMSYQINNSLLSSVCALAKESLIPDGLFMFDCWHGMGVLNDKPVPKIKEIKINNRERIIRFTQPEFDMLNHIVNINFKVWKIKDNNFNETDEIHPMRFLFPQEIKYFLEVAGFKDIKFCPFLNLEKDLSYNDWNMMVIGR
ncbi:methyltransferase domain-containing protein [Candidatus Desantisbacteria bacterium]|nr:methyltransferase domain-containing protein [Candidatus Desantisbacteria bacterium]